MLSARDNLKDFLDSDLNQTWRTGLLRRANAKQDFTLFMDRLTPSLLRKPFQIGEGANMEFIRQNTTISVPRIHRTPQGGMFMDFIEGEMLYECWDKLSTLMQFRVACTVRLYIKQMRALKCPTVGSLHNGYVGGGMLFDDQDYGTFEDVQHFR